MDNQELKEIIEKLYVKEGRTKSYICNLLNIKKAYLSYLIGENNWVQGNNRYIKKSTQKFINNNRDKICNLLQEYYPDINKVAYLLEIRTILLKEILLKDKRLNDFYLLCKNKYNKKLSLPDNNEHKQQTISNINENDLKPILGYNNYFISSDANVYYKDELKNIYTELPKSLNFRNNKRYTEIAGKTLCVDNIYNHVFKDTSIRKEAILNEDSLEITINNKKYTFKTKKAYNKFIEKYNLITSN